MEAKKLNVEKRQGAGKGAAGRLRGDGKIPAVVYGHTTPTAITVDAREFRNAFRRITENTIVELHMQDGVHEVLVKDYQKDNLSGQILHIDFYEFEKGKALRTRVPVRLVGSPVGVKEGGILEVLLHQLEVECLPKDLPEELTLDISELALDRALHVSAMVLPAGVKSMVPSDQVVCLVAHRKAEEEVAPAAVEGEVPAEGEEGAVAEEGAEAAEGTEEGGKPEKSAKAEKGAKPEKGGKPERGEKKGKKEE